MIARRRNKSRFVESVGQIGIVRMIVARMLAAGENSALASQASIFGMNPKRTAPSLEVSSGCTMQLLDIVALSVEGQPGMEATINSVAIMQHTSS